jgi:hypothetical protein
MRRLFLIAAVLAVAGCGDGNPDPIAADPTGPALNGSSLPNLYVHTLLPQRDANGVLKLKIRVCNSGTVSAGSSTTYLEHWHGFNYEIYDLYTTNLSAGWCTWVTSPALMDVAGLGHDYYTKADDYLVITESNENDNEAELYVAP